MNSTEIGVISEEVLSNSPSTLENRSCTVQGTASRPLGVDTSCNQNVIQQIEQAESTANSDNSNITRQVLTSQAVPGNRNRDRTEHSEVHETQAASFRHSNSQSEQVSVEIAQTRHETDQASNQPGVSSTLPTGHAVHNRAASSSQAIAPSGPSTGAAGSGAPSNGSRVPPIDPLVATQVRHPRGREDSIAPIAQEHEGGGRTSPSRSVTPLPNVLSNSDNDDDSEDDLNPANTRDVLVNRRRGDVLRLFHAARQYYTMDPAGIREMELRGKPCDNDPLQTYLGEGKSIPTVTWESVKLGDLKSFFYTVLYAILPIRVLAKRAMKLNAVTAARPNTIQMEPNLLRLFTSIYDNYLTERGFPDGMQVKWRQKMTEDMKYMILAKVKGFEFS